MRLDELDKILDNVENRELVKNYAFVCSAEFKIKFNSIKKYKEFPVYYFNIIKYGNIYLIPDPTINNPEWFENVK